MMGVSGRWWPLGGGQWQAPGGKLWTVGRRPVGVGRGFGRRAAEGKECYFNM